ncbi:IS3 family transposase [Rhodococcus sp. KRD175]|uniref:IS3 family transposase n=1 Tax=Rhodococcus sp. KRD175 TaxID=2729729 RepID=UPI0019D10766|nr:IS3 family transposase [Rhodococcus sp. KRD175]
MRARSSLTEDQRVAAVALFEDGVIDWFNNDRISLRLDGLSPVQYRAQALAA